MKIILDTHVALWMFNDCEKLSVKAEGLLMDEGNELYISLISAWEIAIKTSIGKLSEFEGGVKSFLDKLDETPIDIIPILPCHIELVESLPMIHRDPFDRLLIAAAVKEKAVILTADENIHKYNPKVRTEW